MKYLTATIIVAAFFSIFASETNAQISETPVYLPSNKIIIPFTDVIEKVNDKAPVGANVDCPVIYFQQGAEDIFLYCDAVVSGGGFTVELSNFRTSRDNAAAVNQMVNLTGGSVSNCDDSDFQKPKCIVKGISAGQNRQYFIHWIKKVKVRGQPKAQTVFSEAKIGSNLEKTPTIKVGFVKDEADRIRFTPQGVTPDNLINVFGKNPGLIKVLYDFPAADPALDFETSVTDINCLDGTKNLPCRDQNGLANNAVILALETPLPIRPDKYTAVVKIPWQELRNAGVTFLNNDWKIPDREDAGKDFLSNGMEVKLLPNKPERGKSEYAFEAGFTSTVNSADRKRNNVGIFGLRVRLNLRDRN